MALHLHRAERADVLADALGELLQVAHGDPFASELVAVPTPGVERWLAQSLSSRLGTGPGGDDGVCAGVDFCSPRRLTARALSGAGEIDPDDDPWLPRRAAWTLIGILDRVRGQAWAAPVWAYLTRGSGQSDQPVGGRRFTLAQHLAELFARYGSVRPLMIDSWLHGRDLDGSGGQLDPDRAWQAELWRRLRTELDVPSPAERTDSNCWRLRADPSLTDLPDRVAVFGPTRLDADQLQVLAALAAGREVHLWLPHPSPALWATVADRTGDAAGPRREDPTRDAARHRLLGYLGRDVREFQECLGHIAADVPVDGSHHLAAAREPAVGGPTLLARLQADLAADRPLPTIPDHRWRPTDSSITFHACHGPDRQVEVLRELLVGLLADDPSLEPRDIIVMCPDIERFAPLIAASFGLDPDPATGVETAETGGAEHPGHRLRVRLADRSLRQLNPLLGLLARLLQLGEHRVTAAELLDLLGAVPVARRFGFTEDDLVRLRELVPSSGVRWGLDTAHRARFGMDGFGQNTWAAGLDRLLLGVAMAEQGEHTLGTALPMDAVDSSDVDRIGRLAEAVSRIRLLRQRCGRRQSLTSWVTTLTDALEGLAAVPPSDSWQQRHAYGELALLLDAAPDPATELAPAEVKALLTDTFGGRPGRANFRTGTLTMCTMQPMRSVPHRVICLLGVDDTAFPRGAAIDGDDILALDPWVGDRDPRSEDRQLMLDAIVAATERLVLIYSGADPRTGAERPPAVPVGELLDVLDLTAAGPDGGPLRPHLITRHPLQPFDPRDFVAGPRGEPFSFDRRSRDGARAGTDPRVAAPQTELALTPFELPSVLTLAELQRFLAHPIRALLRGRTLLSTVEDAELSDQLPVALDGLQAWAVGDRMLHRALAGADLDDLVAAEWRRGELPPRQLGAQVLSTARSRVTELTERAAPALVGPSATLDLAVQLPGAVLTGTAGPLHGERLISVHYGWLTAKHRLDAWVTLLALTVSHPGRPWQALTFGRRQESLLGPVQPEFAAAVLTDLVDLYRTGMSGALPFAPKTSGEYARLREKGWDLAGCRPLLEQAWQRERDEAYDRFFADPPGLAGLERQPALGSEQRGPIAEPHRFGCLAQRVFLPLLRAEELR